MRLFTRVVLCTKVDVQCDKLAKTVVRTSTVASIVNLVQPTTDASLLHRAFTFIELS